MIAVCVILSISKKWMQYKGKKEQPSVIMITALDILLNPLAELN